MQVEFYLAGEITQVIDSIPWVRCASGNVCRRLVDNTWVFCIGNVKRKEQLPLNFGRLTCLLPKDAHLRLLTTSPVQFGCFPAEVQISFDIGVPSKFLLFI